MFEQFERFLKSLLFCLDYILVTQTIAILFVNGTVEIEKVTPQRKTDPN